MFSYIQQLILTNLLKTSQGLRYSGAHPADIEDNLYHYHLQFLIKKGVIEYKNGLYTLTEKGKSTVQQIDAEGRSKEYFKVGALPYAVRITKEKKELLLEKRLRQPYYGDINPSISGRIQLGETIEEAAKARFEEKTGLIATFKWVGVIRKIRRNKDGRVFEDCFYNVCYAEDPKGVLEEKNVYGEHFWETFENAIKYQKSNTTASDLSEEIIERLFNGDFSPFCFQEEIKINT